MKKLLTILSSFAVTATGASAVVACGSKDDKKTKTDLDGLDDAAKVTSKDEIAEFRTALIAVLNVKAGFEKLADADLEPIKKGDNELAKGDLTNGEINITITAKGENFTGTKNIKVTFTKGTTPAPKKDLDGLDATVTVKSNDEVADFKAALITVLNQKTGFNELADADLKPIEKKAGGALEKTDIKAGAIEIKITAQGNKFTGNKEITVTWSKETTPAPKKDLDGLDATVTVKSNDEVADFKAALITVLNQKTGFNELADADLKPIEKKAGGALEKTDIKAGAIEIKITAQGDKFTGNKEITVTWAKP